MSKIKLTLVGDIFPANLGYNSGFGIASQYLKHKGNTWEKSINKILHGADIVFGNLESPLIYEQNYCNNNSFAGHSSFTEFLKKHKINIVSIANNHILEQGVEGFLSTCSILEKNGIKYVGKNCNDLSNVEIITIKGYKIGFCAFNNIHDISNPKSYAELNEDNIYKTIENFKLLNLDYKIVSLHWGNEYIHYPSLNQIKLAHKIIDAGADIIIGHHPHVVQPVEKYRNGLIFYSMGNFLFDMLWSKKVRHGLVAKLILDGNHDINFKLVSIRLSNEYAPHLYPEGLKKINKINKNFQKLLSKSINNEEKYDKNYIQRVNWYRFIERILMKKSIVKNWNKMSKQSKKEFIYKIKNKIL